MLVQADTPRVSKELLDRGAKRARNLGDAAFISWCNQSCGETRGSEASKDQAGPGPGGSELVYISIISGLIGFREARGCDAIASTLSRQVLL